MIHILKVAVSLNPEVPRPGPRPCSEHATSTAGGTLCALSLSKLCSVLVLAVAAPAQGAN